MGRIPEETIETIRDRVDIVDIVGRHVTLKRAGRTFKGLCPFHQEKTPSFVVSPDRGTFHCFGCGEGGNAFGFLMQHENLTFPEAVRSLAADVGVEVPETGGGPGRGVVDEVVAANREAFAFYRSALMSPEGEAARRYLAGRGFDAETAERFGVGFAPDRWDGLVGALRKAGIAPEAGEKAGLLRERDRGGHYDLLRGRVIFPIKDVRDRVVAFGGRALGADQEPKYLNTPESPVFRKRESFYGFPQALEAIRRSDRVVVSEGYFDQIALARAGVEEAVATCGTALTEEHARNLRRRAKHVVLLFDGDGAGQRAMLKALEILLPHGLRVSAAALPEGQDPDDVLANQGADALRATVDDARPALDLAIAHAVAAGCSTPWERADAVGAVTPLLARVQDPVERGEFTRRLALAAGTDAADVDAAVRRSVRGDSEPEPDEYVPREAGPEERHYVDILRILLDHPESRADLDADELVHGAPDPVWAVLAREIHGLGGGDVSGLTDRLDEAPRRRLSALAALPAPGLEDPERARRAVLDKLAWLRRRRHRGEARATTAEMASGATDPTALLQEKQRQLERRRNARIASR